MAASDIQICNFALGHLGITSGIVAFTTRSQEAASCQLYYEQTRDEVLRDFAWPFASAEVALALIQQQPTLSWSYRYRYPSDAIALRAIDVGFDSFVNPLRIPYTLGNDSQGRTLDTNYPTAAIRYTQRVTDPTLFPADFTQAVALKLASYLAPSVTGGDQFKLGAQALQKYQYQIQLAKVNALNEEQAPAKPETSSLLRARQGGIAHDSDVWISTL